jgi:arylsulfatase A-like enzyme
MGAALYLALTAGVVLGALLGPFLVPPGRLAVKTVREWLHRLKEHDVEAMRTLAAQSLALATLGAVWGWVAYRVCFDILLGFAKPESIVAVLLLSHAVFAWTLALAWPWATYLGRLAFDRLSSVRRFTWVGRTAWAVPAAVALPLCLALGLFLFSHRDEVSALPWRMTAPLPVLVAGWAIAARWPYARTSLGSQIGVGAIACAWFASGLTAWSLRSESTRERRVAFETTLSGRAGDAVWTAAFDFDRDGQLSIFGGGDCAPFDPHRYTGAVDIPGNGIDEDCDGQDLPTMVLRPRPRSQVGQSTLPSRPTIILITVDALAAPRLQTLGSTQSLMPHVDDLARTSAIFTHAFSQGPSTRLSFPSMFTSRWDSQLTHLFAPHLPYSLAVFERQLQDVLADSGYETAAVLPNIYFDSSHWASMTRGFQRVNTSALALAKNNAPLVTDAALQELAAASGERPLYLWVHYYDAHGPYAPVPGASRTERSDEALYNGELGYIDHEIGRLLEAINARPTPTYVFLTADHASVFRPNPARRGHYGYDLFTATLHVPLIVHGPGIRPSRLEGVVSTMDIAPTIADLVHGAAPQFEGTSLWPEILTEKHDSTRIVFHEFYLPERGFRGEDPLGIVSARTERWNLVLDRIHGSFALYDWNADYFEENDLFETLNRNPEVLHLRSALGAFVQQFHRRIPAAQPLRAANDKR